MKTFKCDFGAGVSCELQAPEKAPEKGAYAPVLEWTGTPKPETLRTYINWINSVNQILSNDWGIGLMHVFLTGPSQQETWAYEPGKPPTKISEGRL